MLRIITVLFFAITLQPLQAKNVPYAATESSTINIVPATNLTVPVHVITVPPAATEPSLTKQAPAVGDPPPIAGRSFTVTSAGTSGPSFTEPSAGTTEPLSITEPSAGTTDPLSITELSAGTSGPSFTVTSAGTTDPLSITELLAGTTDHSADTYSTSHFTFDAGYFGETITKAGAIVAVQKRISNTGDLHHIRLNAAFYRHPGYNNNLLVLPEYLFRKTGSNGYFFEVAAGGGWMYQKPDRLIIVYDNGSFRETNRGWSYFAPAILLGGGKKIQKGALKETAFSAGLRWFGQYPFNGFLMHHLALEVRVTVPVNLFKNQRNLRSDE